MKRIHLFEFEDFPWFPNWLRIRMTRYIVAMHRLLGSPTEIAELLARALEHTDTQAIHDVCSGGGGPLIDALPILRDEHGKKDVTLTFSDLYPNTEVAAEINGGDDASVRYLTTPVDATEAAPERRGVRTMICSLHHMTPDMARTVLQAARDSKQPFCMFEISDNGQPRAIWWIAIPFAFLTVFFVTPFVRPLSWQQLFFTYVIPLIPAFIAWDGAVSNARTYTLDDMNELLEGIRSDDYTWEMGTIANKAKKLYLLGLPSSSA